MMFDDILNRFDIDAGSFGQFSGVYYIGYAFMHIPLGIMLDKYGPRKIMTGCILFSVFGLIPLIYTDVWVYAVLGRLLVGIGSSAAILGTFKIIRMAFSEKQFTTMLSLSVTIGLIGAIYGGGPVGYMVSELGYVVVTKIFAMLGLALATITYMIVPEVEEDESVDVIQNIGKVLTNFKVMVICVASGLMVGPLEGFADVWGAKYLNIVYGFSTVSSSYIPSLLFLGMCFGAPIISIFAEKTRLYMTTIIAAGFVMLITFALLLKGDLNMNLMSGLFLISGMCCGYQILAIFKASKFVPENLTGLTTAVVNMVIMIFGYAFHSSIGNVIDTFGGCNSAEAFNFGVSIIPAGLVLGILGFLLVALIEKRRVKL